MVTHGSGGARHSSPLGVGHPPPSVALPRAPVESLQSILASFPVARLASVCGYKGWQIQFEERFPDGHLGDPRAVRLTVRGPDLQLQKDGTRFASRDIAEAVLAHQILRAIEAGGLGASVPPELFADQQASARLSQWVDELGLPRPRAELVMGDKERLRTFTAQCYVVLNGAVIESLGVGRSIRDACQSAAQRMIERPDLRAQLSLVEDSDPSSVLVSSLRRSGHPPAQLLVHHSIDPVGVACVLPIPGRPEPLRFLGHADSYAHAREVCAARAGFWISHRVRELRQKLHRHGSGSSEH